MTTKKKTIKPAPITTRAEMESLMGEIAGLTINHQRITATLNAAITEATSLHQPQLDMLSVSLKEKFDLAYDWALANDAEFKGARTIHFALGEIGFRTGNHTVKARSKWNLERALAAMVTNLEKWGGYVRTKQEIDKDALIKDRATLANLADVGLRIVQSETFFVEPLMATTEPRMKEAA